MKNCGWALWWNSLALMAFPTPFSNPISPLKPWWASMLVAASSPGGLPPSFSSSYISLLPKTLPSPSPDQFCPITVTSSVYCIIGKYFTRSFVSFILPFIHPSQHALLPGHSSLSYLFSICDKFLSAAHHCSLLFLIQTDFQKAYDFLNRSAILYALCWIHLSPPCTIMSLTSSFPLLPTSPSPTALCVPFLLCQVSAKAAPSPPVRK